MASPPTGAIYTMTSTAVTGNTSGAGFNPTATYFNTDLAATAGTTTAPSVTSASYTFVPADIGNWVYIKSGTNWIAGWYNITNVIGGAAILNGTIGAAVLSVGATGIVTYSTAQGCVTGSYVSGTASGTYGVDYSQVDTVMANSTTATSSGAGSVILFAGSTQSMLGNYVNIISGTNATAGWYEIIAESTGVSITTDRASTTGVGANIVMNIGGSGRLNGLEDAFQAMLPAGSIIFVKNGLYTLSGAISTASTNGTAAAPIFWIGYNSVWGDTCTGSNRPIFALGANACQWSQYQIPLNISFTTTSASGIQFRVGGKPYNCKSLNSSTTANRFGFSIGSAAGVDIYNCESISQNGHAINTGVGNSTFIVGNYAHDSVNGIFTNGAGGVFALENIIESNTSAALNISGSDVGPNIIIGNTLYGREAIMGTGISLSTSSINNRVVNNIIYGFTTGINETTAAQNSNFSLNNDFFNNTTDNTNWVKSTSDIALNPSFTNVTQVTGTVGQGLAGSKFQDTTKNFTTAGVVVNQDFLHITSGGSLTAGCYLITAITTTTNPNDTLTLNNNPGTGAATGVYWITVGHNFQIGTNLKAQGFPSFTNATGSLTTSYMDIGAVQRQEPAGAGGGTSILKSGIIQGIGAV